MVNLVPFIWLVCVCPSLLWWVVCCWGKLLVQLFLEPSPESRYSRGMLSLSSCPLFSLCPTPYVCLCCPPSPLIFLLTGAFIPSFAFLLWLPFPSYILLHTSPFTPHSPSFPFLPTPLLLIPFPATLSLTDRKTNVRSERLFNLKLCCLAPNINSALVWVSVLFSVLREVNLLCVISCCDVCVLVCFFYSWLYVHYMQMFVYMCCLDLPCK